MEKDSTIALLRDPYRFISRTCRAHGTDLFETRLLLKKTICMTGRDAAEQFYDPHHFIRSGATPKPIRATLFGKGSVLVLDDEAHLNRKQMFMSLMTPESIGRLSKLTIDWWKAYSYRWALTDRILLYDELHEILTGAACAWVGVPLREGELRRRTKELVAMFDDAAKIGLGHFRSRFARKRAEKWIGDLIRDIRSSGNSLKARSPVEVVAWHRDLSGKFLSPHVAAVEVLNLLRPVVALSVFIVFAAHALHEHPESREKLYARENGYDELFVQELRRFYPFFPFLMAQVREDFDWGGCHFSKGMQVALDLYGTNHDPRIWESPGEFKPERFRNWDEKPFSFIPQGGGDHYVHHRCAGEWVTIGLLKAAVEFLVFRLNYDVPDQDLNFDWKRLPALPKSRFVISNVRILES